MTIERVIKLFEVARSLSSPGSEGWAMFDIALKALIAQQEDKGNKPITQEEFWGMEGEPIWAVPAYKAKWKPQWAIVRSDHIMVLPDVKRPNMMQMVFGGFYAYRRPPKLDR